jgi:uncharacterized protein (TIGR02246 family)
MKMELSQLRDLGAHYTEAWCSKDPARVAEFYSPNGSLRVNDDAPAVGRRAIAAVAQEFMTTFPDLCVTMDEVLVQGDRAVYRWTLVGTSTGPAGAENGVCVSGYEEWEIDIDGLIVESRGHFDNEVYQRQLKAGLEQK